MSAEQLPPPLEAEEDIPSGATVALRLPPCARCGQTSKYRCPRCAAASCSAACVTAHKAGAPGGACTGRRDVAAFVPLLSFGEAQLRADLSFLEEAGRAAERAKRARCELPASTAAAAQRSSRLRAVRLRSVARARRCARAL
jgi:hypothetical protein